VVNLVDEETAEAMNRASPGHRTNGESELVLSHARETRRIR
jgi:hypothetical protein